MSLYNWQQSGSITLLDQFHVAKSWLVGGVHHAKHPRFLSGGLSSVIRAFPIICSVFDQLCYSIMLQFLINYASKCTNYASYNMTNYSHTKLVNFIRFSLKMQWKTKEENLTSYQ